MTATPTKGAPASSPHEGGAAPKSAESASFAPRPVFGGGSSSPPTAFLPSAVPASRQVASQRGLFARLDEPPLEELGGDDAALAPARRSPCHAEDAGFNLHAGVRFAAHDREGRERLFRYGAWPPFALERPTQPKKLWKFLPSPLTAKGHATIDVLNLASNADLIEPRLRDHVLVRAEEICKLVDKEKYAEALKKWRALGKTVVRPDSDLAGPTWNALQYLVDHDRRQAAGLPDIPRP